MNGASGVAHGGSAASKRATMLSPKLRLTGLDDKLIVDLFAGGGGMSAAMEMAWGRSPDIAIDHDDDALSLHRLNHPQTRHFVADVFEVDPRGATRGRPVGWLHLSPDCTHFSQAKGGQPRSAKIRGLAWVGIRWAGQVRPDWISLENVKQFRKWGPLVAKRDRETGRVVRLDGTIAEPGERVPVQQQFLVPDLRREGQTYRRFRSILRGMGYTVDSHTIIAADQGGHTTRERHFEVGNCVGEPIRWPEATHHKKPTRGQRRWRPAADCIDWSIPCPSIFARKRPLADATLRRIARGIHRYVLESGEPFIVPNNTNNRPHSIGEPAPTVTTGGRNMRVCPTLIQVAHGEGRGTRAYDFTESVGTIHAGGGSFALACAYLMQANGGFNVTPGHDLRQPTSTVTNTGSQQQLVTAHLAHFRGNCDARPTTEPLRTVSAGGQHHGVVQCTLSTEQTEGAERVAALLINYYGNGTALDLRDPLATITTKDRMALVTVHIKGTPYVIVDIGLRMLQPRELFRAQDFPESYVIDRGHDGRKFSKSTQVRMVGNSVDPLMAVGFLRLNAPELAIQEAA